LSLSEHEIRTNASTTTAAALKKTLVFIIAPQNGVRREGSHASEFVCWKFDGKVAPQQHAQSTMLIE
jgi:hypothetical protein